LVGDTKSQANETFDNRCRWWALLGSVVLVVYGFIPTFQPTSDFGRIFACYGGFFILYSYGWGWALDGAKPDTGDDFQLSAANL